MAKIAGLLKLNVLQLTLSRWDRDIRLADNPGPAQSYTRPAISEGEARIARQLLGEIQLAFDDAEKYAQQYKAKKPNPSSAMSEVCGSSGDGDLVVLAAKTRELAMRGRKSAGILQKTKWALIEQKLINRLVEDVIEHVNDPVELFPAAQATQQQLCFIEVSELAPEGTEQELLALRGALSGIEETMASAPQQIIDASARRDHISSSIEADEAARTHNGDRIAKDKAKVINENTSLRKGEQGLWDV
ncbi:hypothetical protein B0A49_02791 [Cryomyces minteri]|uniref:Prion-inhibition and propagation HeLo domain-containing protein n=1 Tax=Cryomyces minteri TaxID=331657 RepID=A0A4U0XME4_9PEZI|nr:hypothetical protein B0A49_03922 [Cryomyces minteri]TKA76563.1 hypothetical protein B0A49_02791 [Cryomyces minteri]